MKLWTFVREERDESSAVRAIFGAVMAETQDEARRLLPINDRDVELRLHRGPVGIVALVRPPPLQDLPPQIMASTPSFPRTMNRAQFAAEGRTMNLTRGSLEGTIETLKEDLEKDWALRDSAWVAGLARGLASWLRAFADLYDPPLHLAGPGPMVQPTVSVDTNVDALAALAAMPGRRIASLEGGGSLLDIVFNDGMRVRIEGAVNGGDGWEPGDLAFSLTPPPYPERIPVNIDFGNPPIREGEPIYSFESVIPEMKGSGVVAIPFRPGPDIGPQGRNYDGRPYTDDPGHPLVWPTPLKDCDCQPVGGVVYKNLSCHCTKVSNAGEPCPCRCHPENR